MNVDGRRVPSDYHKVLKKRLDALEHQLHAELGAFQARGYVDTGPLVERSLATAAGLGWTGKNTCLIHPKLGSFGFLAVLLTSLPVQAEPAPPARCRTAAAPAAAASRPAPPTRSPCPIAWTPPAASAYLTIEHKGPIAPDPAASDLLEGIGRNVFGCDICQDVCPWNGKAPFGTDPDLQPRSDLVNPALQALAALDEAGFELMFNGSPVRRAGFNGLRRNIAIAMGNSGLSRFVPCLQAWSAAADEGLRAAARWALEKLHPGNASLG